MKVFVRERGSDAVLAMLDEGATVFTSRLTYVECRAALSRAGRAGQLKAAQETVVTRELDDRWRALLVVDLDEALIKRAGELAAHHPLRAADAIHLASAELLAPQTRADVLFACWDPRLWEAAGSVGFTRAPATAP